MFKKKVDNALSIIELHVCMHFISLSKCKDISKMTEHDQLWNEKNENYSWNDAYGCFFGVALISIYVSSAVTSYQLNL